MRAADRFGGPARERMEAIIYLTSGVQAWGERVTGKMTASEDLRARRYHRLQFWLAAVGLGLGAIYLVAFLRAGVAHGALALATRLSEALAWRVAAVAFVLGAGERVLTFPLAWVRGWWLPRRYGLLHQLLAAWLGDRLKAAAIAGGFGLVTVEVIYLLMAATS